MSLEVLKRGDILVIHFSQEYPENSSIYWLFDKIKGNGFYELANTFRLTENSIVDYDTQFYSFGEFKLAELVVNENGKFYKIDKTILQINFDLYFEKSCNITEEYFLTSRKTSIFKIINDIGIDSNLYIGGDTEDSISELEYIKLIKSLPNNYEHKLYDNARVCAALRKFFCVKNDRETQFQKYVNKKDLVKESFSETDFEDFDIKRYEFLLNKLDNMLISENGYNEKDWQNEILRFIKVIFPKYIISEKEAIIRENNYHGKKRIDIILGDFNGNIDIIEIKKPESAELLRKGMNRNNYIPSAILQGAIMQAEKYIYYLSRDGITAENNLNTQFNDKKPKGYLFKIRNPKAIIIMGRTKHYNKDQLDDFEIIKRKYKNIVDIISYDDLLNRLETVIKLLRIKTV